MQFNSNLLYLHGDDSGCHLTGIASGICLLPKLLNGQPFLNLLANGKIERELKAFIASALSGQNIDFYFCLEKEYGSFKPQLKTDMLAFANKTLIGAAEFKCSFSYDANDCKKSAKRQPPKFWNTLSCDTPSKIQPS